MRFLQHYSGSSGNLYQVVSSNRNRLIIDPGVTWKKIVKVLDHNLSNISGCLVTHRHLDHCKGINEVSKATIPIYASQETIDSTGCAGRRTMAIKNNDLITMDGFQVFVFDTQHDCDGSVGFAILDLASKEYLLFATDTKCIVPRFSQKFSIVAIEASYCGETLARKVEQGVIHEALAKRLLTSHMEIKETERYIDKFIDKEKLHQIHLLHISGENADRERCRKHFEKVFMMPEGGVVICQDA